MSTIPGGTLGYVVANILETSPYVAPTNGTESVTAWVMLENDSLPQLWSQVGWWKYATGARYSFSEWTYNTQGQTTDQLHPSWPVGNWTLYEVFWNPNRPGIEHYINGSLATFHGRVFTMRRADIYGETHNVRSQMPGAISAPERFADSHVANLSGTIYPLNGTQDNSNSSIYGYLRINDKVIHIWDKACD